MAEITISFLPSGITADADPGVTISKAAADAGIDLPSGCFGKHLCGRCRIRILKGDVSPATDDEKARLGKEQVAQGYRLGCRTTAITDVEVEIPLIHYTKGIAVEKPFLLDEIPVEPYIYTYPMSLPPPSLSDNLADLDRIIRYLAQEKNAPDVQVRQGFISHLSGTLRETNWNVAAVLMEHRSVPNRISILDVIPMEPEKIPGLYGIAIDMGTTTLAGYLIDHNSGHPVGSHYLPNPQSIYGSDVITRLQFCKENGENGINLLQDSLIEGCRSLIKGLVDNARLNANNIYSITLVGNTVMQHLLLGLDPAGLAAAPYSTVVTKYPVMDACELDLLPLDSCSHFFPMINLPGVAGYFGSDAVACALVAGQYKQDQQKQGALVCIDIGTNGEILLHLADGRILGCSTAAGPAFEGAHISCGMPALPGAISNLTFDGNNFKFQILDELGVTFEVNDSSPQPCPLGFTGAAIIDLIAGLLQYDIIDRTGKLVMNERNSHRVRKRENGQPEFVALTIGDDDAGSDRSNRGDLIFTQDDIRQVQLAKAAISAGIKTLVHRAEIELGSIETILLAGAFGTHINTDNVKKIGLIPDIPGADIKSIGNAAGAGAVLATVSKSKMFEFYDIASRIEYIELATDDRFDQLFIDSMGFNIAD